PELKTALTGLGKIIPRSHSLPVLKSIRVTHDDQGTVTFQSTDLENFITFQAKDQHPGPICDFLVPFDALNRVLKGTVDEVQLFPEAKNKVRIKVYINSSPVEQTVEAVPIEEFPIQPRFEGK